MTPVWVVTHLAGEAESSGYEYWELASEFVFASEAAATAYAQETVRTAAVAFLRNQHGSIKASDAYRAGVMDPAARDQIKADAEAAYTPTDEEVQKAMADKYAVPVMQVVPLQMAEVHT